MTRPVTTVGKTAAAVITAALIALNVAAWVIGDWHPTAIVIGFLLGFAMQRSAFCGAAILSSVVLHRETRGVVGAGLAIVVAMAGFAVMTAGGWMTPNPKPVQLFAAVIGGLVFGCGMVLAGGCASGSLFKAGEGRLTSMLAVLGIAIGSNMVGPGLLGPAVKVLRQSAGGVRTPTALNEIVGLDYPAGALVVGLVGLLALSLVGSRRSAGRVARRGRLIARLASPSWTFSVGGLVIGVLGWLGYLSSAACGRHYPLGITHGITALFSILIGGRVGVNWWLALVVIGVVIGSTTSAGLAGSLRLRSADPLTLLVALVGGVLVGAGAMIGSGCFVGNFLSGWALLSVQSFVFGLFTIAANWITTILYLRGLK